MEFRQTIFTKLLILIVNALLPEPLYHICPNTTTYTQNSTYQANLQSLLSDLSSENASNNLFLNATVGDSSPDVAYGLVLCRGDVTVHDCHECLEMAAAEIVKRCPEEKETYIWYDNCMLRYSSRSFFGSMATNPPFYMWNTNKVSNPDRFDEVLGKVMNGVIDHASGTGNVGPLKGFATGESDITSVWKFKSQYKSLA